MFQQTLNPAGNLWLTVLISMVPFAALLYMLAVLRLTAWLATIIGGLVTILLGVLVWRAPAGDTLKSYLYGGFTGFWAIDWITFWGLIIFNTLVLTGIFERFKKWMIHHATADIRIQTIMLAWAFGALLEGLVGFGYPWAVVVPILVGLGIADLDAIRVAALANNAPLSYRAFGGAALASAEKSLMSNPSAPRLELGSATEALSVWLPYIVLIAVVVSWTGPWSHLPGVSWFRLSVAANSSVTQSPILSVFNFTPFAGGTSILVSWVVLLLILRPQWRIIPQVFSKTFKQMWGALLVAFFIFALAYIFVFTGMANSLAYGLSKIGVFFVVLAPILGWIGVALSGSNTATNAMFGPVQALTGRLLNLPVLLLPSFNSVGAEVGKPIAPQTASVGVSTSKLVRSEGQVIRHNMGWTLVMLAYLVVISAVFYFFLSNWMSL